MSPKKLNWVLPNVTYKIRTKSIRPMVWALNNFFFLQKAKMNFTQSIGFAEGFKCYYHYLTHSSALPADVMEPV